MGIAPQHSCIIRGSYDPFTFPPICYSWYFGTTVSHPLLLLKICPLLWATLLSMHCSCMLMEERSIHRLILQYFATVSNYKYCHACNWWFYFRENGMHYKITGQERCEMCTNKTPPCKRRLSAKPGIKACFSKVPEAFWAWKAILCLLHLHSRSKLQAF